MAKLMAWEELLSYVTLDDNKNMYGPHTQAVVNCFETLDTVSWFSLVGAETAGKPDNSINTWSASIDLIFYKPGKIYDADGQLKAAASVVSKFRTDKKLKKWIDKAVGNVAEYADFSRYIPKYFEKPEVEFMHRYLQKYLENLLVEIIASDELECTYYREQLSYFEAGHFACGWLGEWPKGHFRVF